MKKMFIATLAAASLIGTVSFAGESSVSGGFEASGHIVTGAGWQRVKAKVGVPAVAPTVGRDINGTIPGVIGAYSTAAGVNKEDDFKFFVDSVELDLAKTLGENIRMRADLDFGSRSLNGGPRFNNGAGAGFGVGVLVEQAYATANLGVGNGLEFLLGRFNVPMGFESNDVNQNDTISRSMIYRALRPHSFTGAKLYYAFSDLVDLNFYVANNGLSYESGGGILATTDLPALGFRLGFNWGEEGKKNTLGWSGAVGQDHANVKKHMSFLGDVDFKWWATDNFALGGEGIYRQIDTTTPGGKNGKYLGGLLNLHYDFSDVWDGTLKYCFASDINGLINAGVGVTSVTGAVQSLTSGTATGGSAGDQISHEITLAGSYAIADGAKLKLEGGYTLINPSGPSNNQHVFGVGGAFAYDF